MTGLPFGSGSRHILHFIWSAGRLDEAQQTSINLINQAGLLNLAQQLLSIYLNNNILFHLISSGLALGLDIARRFITTFDKAGTWTWHSQQFITAFNQASFLNLARQQDSLLHSNRLAAWLIQQIHHSIHWNKLATMIRLGQLITPQLYSTIQFKMAGHDTWLANTLSTYL